MSAQASWWAAVTRDLAKQKEIKPTVDTCPLCWAQSGLPAVVFKGDSDKMCGTCADIVQRIRTETN